MMFRVPTRFVRFDDRHPNCPACGMSMIETPVPQGQKHLDGDTRDSRWILINDPGSSMDRVECPDCGKQFPAELEEPKYKL
jgi:predicted RNA-binding Zn-ribbon protein involved in translation (DUF1610 family)